MGLAFVLWDQGLMRVLAIVLTGLLGAGCSDILAVGNGEVFTLYRNSVLDNTMRIHVASFDAEAGKEYNSGNCAIAADLFQRQSGVKTRFWCEAGRYRSIDN